MTGAGAGAGARFIWRAGLVAGLQVGRALGCSGCLGLGSAVPVPHVPRHPTSICDKDVNCTSGGHRYYYYGLETCHCQFLIIAAL